MASPATQGAPSAGVVEAGLLTAYLPPTWGWVTLAWMRRWEYV